MRSAATGAGTGADWTNAYKDLPASLTRGVTYWVAAGTYAPHVFNDPVSGTTLITIQAPTASNHGTSTGWSSSYVGQAEWECTTSGCNGVGNIWDVSQENYIVFNGAYCTPRSDYPAICDSGYGFYLNANGNGGNGNTGNDCILCAEVQGGEGYDRQTSSHAAFAHDQTFEYLDINGMNQSDSLGDSSIADSGFSFEGGSYDIYVGHSYIHNVAWQFFMRGNHSGSGTDPFGTPYSDYGCGCNITIEYSHLHWDAAGADANAPHATPLDESEGIQDYTLRYNLITDMGGNGSTGGTSFGPDTASGADYNNGNGYGGPWYIYGNVLYADNTQKCQNGDGFMAVYDYSMTNGDVWLVQNTFGNWGYGFCATGSQSTDNTYLGLGLAYNTPFKGFYEENNAFYQMDQSQYNGTTFIPNGSTNNGSTGSGGGATFSPAVVHGYDAWFASPNSGASDTGANAQVSSSSPFVNANGNNFNLSSDTTAGTTLSNTGTYWNGSALVANTFNVDMNGITRGGSGTWDRGALQLASSSQGTLQSVAVTPADPSIVANSTEQFTATGKYSNGSTQNLTDSATWKSSNTSVASVSNAGLATGLEAGTSTITATSSSVAGSTLATVTAATLQSITVTPANSSLAAGNTLQYTATGSYSNGTTQNLTSSVTWSSTNSAAATISSGGLAKGAAAGSTTITATSGSVSGMTGLTVTAATATLQSITVTPANSSLVAGNTLQYTATGHYSNGTTQTITSSITWVSTNSAAATISSGGLAKGVAAGSTTITATSGTVSGSTGLTVTAATATLQSITVTPSNATVTAGRTRQYTATGTFSNGTTQNITTSVTWSSNNTAVATISASGLVDALRGGSTTIRATKGSVSGATGLRVERR